MAIHKPAYCNTYINSKKFQYIIKRKCYSFFSHLFRFTRVVFPCPSKFLRLLINFFFLLYSLQPNAQVLKSKRWKTCRNFPNLRSSETVGSFTDGDGDGDGNENVKKANRLNNQNSNSARVLHFLVYFFAVTARLGREIS